MSAFKSSTTSGGSKSRYDSSNRRDANKTRDGLKLIKHLEKRKAWRIKTYQHTPQAQLSSTTRTLFKHWGVPLLGPKKVAMETKPTVHKRWGRPQ